MRCLFVNWKHGDASQFSVPDNYTLDRRLAGRRRPKRLSVFDTETNSELYLDLSQIRSCFVVTVGADQRVLDTANR